MKFAANTDVSVERSKAEIETVVQRYGATGFMSGWMGDTAMITFEISKTRVRFVLPLPLRDDKAFTHYRANRNAINLTARSTEAAFKLWEQACRQKWRALLLCVKAKLEAVEAEISSFEDEFLAHIVLPDGMTIGDTLRPRLPSIISTGKLPHLLGGPTQ